MTFLKANLWTSGNLLSYSLLYVCDYMSLQSCKIFPSTPMPIYHALGLIDTSIFTYFYLSVVNFVLAMFHMTHKSEIKLSNGRMEAC